MAGTRQVAGFGLGIDRHMDRRGPIGGRNSGRDVFPGVDRNGEGGAEGRGIFNGLLRQVEFFDALGRQRETDQAAGMPGHEIDGLGRDLFGGDDQIAFIFPIFIVDQDDEFALFDVPDCVFDAVEMEVAYY